MARTKQTARKTLVAQTIARRTLGKGGKGKVATKRISSSALAHHSQSEQSMSDIVNTQQFSLKFDDQDKCQKQAVQHTMHKCKNCQAYFTSQSSIELKNNYKKKKQDKSLSDIQRQKYLQNYQNVWICQFCLAHNSIPESYTPPKPENPCIILQKVDKKNQQNVGGQGKVLIFCIDISGSMDMSFQGKTRLQSVKEALLDQVNRLKFQKEDIKVGLITFGNEVNLIGDGAAFKSKILPTDLYKNFDGVVTQLEKVKQFCYPVQKSFNTIKKTISGLSVHGSTALGPGLLSAVQLASKGSVGSKVILCTDGQANVGMGGLMDPNSTAFYTKMAEHAKKRKVMISILSLKGDNCNLKQLGKLSLGTGGSMLKIDPKMLGTQFSKISKQNVIGTQTRLVIKLNRIFKICNGRPEQVSKDLTTMVQDFGNFTQQTQLNFQFDTVPKQQAKKIPQIDIGLYSLKKVPMQIQLTYTGRNNWKYLQIVTDWRQLTQNINDIYQGANFSLFAASVLQRASLKIKDGLFKQADNILAGYWSIVEEKFKKTQSQQNLDKFGTRITKLEKILKSKMKKANITFKLKIEQRKSQPAAGPARGRGRATQRRRQRSRSRSRSRSMESDSQNQVIYKQLRARQRSRSIQRRRSRSRSRSPPRKAPTKQKQTKPKMQPRKQVKIQPEVRPRSISSQSSQSESEHHSKSSSQQQQSVQKTKKRASRSRQKPKKQIQSRSTSRVRGKAKAKK